MGYHTRVSLKKKSREQHLQKDMEVLVKTNLNTIFFLYAHLPKKSTPLSGPGTGNKTCDDRITTMISRQLIYESTAEDVFWVLHTKLQGKRQLECLN